jgi:hypothetical protein
VAFSGDSDMNITKASPPPLVSKLRINAYYLVLVVIAFIYYVFLIAGHSFRLFEPTELGMSFNSMLEHLLRGQFDIDPRAIRFEGFVHNGKTYSYFGIFPALLRGCLYMLSVICRGMMLHASIALSQQRLACVLSLRAWR